MRSNTEEKAPSKSGPFSFLMLRVALFFSLFCILLFSSGTLSHPFRASASEVSEQEIDFLSGYIALHAKTHLSPLVRRQIARSLLKESRRQHVDLYLAIGVVEQESGFDPRALNSASQDYGLFQVHFAFWRRYFARRVPGGLNPLQPNELFLIPVNVRVGLMILKHDLKIEKNDTVRGLGLYSGRKGSERETYVERVLQNEISFFAFHSSCERKSCYSGYSGSR